MTMLIVYIVICLIFSAFFSGMEIAFVTSNKLRIEVEKKQEKVKSGIISVFTHNPKQFISTILVGNNIALVLYGLLMAAILEPLIEKFTSSNALILIVQTLISTLIILVTAEFLPKTLFRINPNSALRLFALPMMVFYVLLYPFAKLTVLMSNSFLSIFFNVNVKEKQDAVFGKVDLDNLVSEAHYQNEAEHSIELDVKIFHNALEFSTIKVRECFVPRTEIEAIDVNEPIENLRKKFIETGYSKILIYKDSIDQIIGYYHVSELFNNPKQIRPKVLPVLIIPETMLASKLLSMFIQENKSMAVVVDEYGGTAGMVTIEDVLEEIFGEIEDEHDTVDLIEKQISENTFIFSGRLEIDYLNEKYKLDFPDSEDYETIAGFILFNHENIPEEKEIIQIGKFRFQAMKVSSARIELIRLTVGKN